MKNELYIFIISLIRDISNQTGKKLIILKTHLPVDDL